MSKVANPLVFASQAMTADGLDGDKQEGITLRDYFAAKAMQGFFASGRISIDGVDFKDVSDNSYEMADAMLKERSK